MRICSLPALALLACAFISPAQTLTITHVNLIDVINGKVRADATVTVEGNRVVRVASSPAPVPASDVPIVVEVGGVRVSLRAGFDRATLGAVLDLLGSRGAR